MEIVILCLIAFAVFVPFAILITFAQNARNLATIAANTKSLLVAPKHVRRYKSERYNRMKEAQL